MENTLTVKDRGATLHISYEDMIKYHGRFHIAGVAIAYKALELGFSKLVAGEIPSREKITFASGLGKSATGVLDGVEMVTRARSRGCLTADTGLGGSVRAPQSPGGGKFYFEFTYDGAKLRMALKEGLVPEEFMALSRQAIAGMLDREGGKRLQQVKEEMAARLMSMKAEDVFDCICKD